MRAMAGLLSIGLGLATPQARQTQMMTLGEVLVLNVPDLAPGADLQAFEAGVRDRVLPALRATAPGVAVHLFQADRGGRKGQYALVWSGSRGGAASFTEGVTTQLGTLVKGGGQSLEYHLVGAEAIGPLPAVDVLGTHFVKVKPDRAEAFERFIRASVHPAVASLRPDLRVLYYRAAAGGGDYLALFALTRTSRDRYWPGGSDSDDLRSAFGPLKGLTGELATYLVEGSYLADQKYAAAVFESREWSDFVLVD